MLKVRLEGCGWSKNMAPVASVRMEANSLTAAEYGEIARYEAGYWCASDSYFISVIVTPKCFVSFDDGGQHTATFGPFNLVRNSGGSIWMAGSHERLLAKWDEPRSGWHCFLDPARLWPTVVVAALPFVR